MLCRSVLVVALVLVACSGEPTSDSACGTAAARAVAVGPVTCVIDCAGAAQCVDIELAPVAAPALPTVVAAVTARGVASGLVEITVIAEDGTARQVPLPPPHGTGGPEIELVGLPRALELVAGDSHVCARDPAGGAWCWGRNDAGQLGPSVDDLRNTAQPRRVAELAAPARVVAAGGFATCAITGEETACWGLLPRPNAGIGAIPELAGAVEITVGGIEGTAAACARSAAGDVTCTHVAAAGGPFTAVATTAESACALDDAGAVTCWGEEYDFANQRYVDPTPSGGIRFTRLFASGTGKVYCGIASSDAVACWGGHPWRSQPVVIWQPPS